MGGALPTAAVRAVGVALAEGLGQLHRSEAVHRDLKPSNILLTASGPRIIDFGIARAIGTEGFTDVGESVGTPAFMSPEQAAGGVHGAPGDVFALAGVLVYAACGRGPFGVGQPAELLFRVRHADPDLGGVAPELMPTLARCLAKDPAHRPTLGELATALGAGDNPLPWVDALPDAVLREIARRGAEVWRTPPNRLPPPPPDAPPPTTETTPARPGPSRRRLLALAGGSALAGAGLAGGGVWAWTADRRRAGGAAAPARPTATRQRPPARVWTFPARCPDTYADVLTTRHGLAMPAGVVLAGVNAESGQGTWQANMYDGWRWTTDGTRVYALREHDEGRTLALGEIDPASGELGPPRVDLADFAGDEDRNQLLCATDDHAYLAARTTSDNRWHLVAVALRTGREVWRRPLDGPTEQRQPPLLGGSVTDGDLFLWREEPYSASIEVAVRGTRDGRQRWSQWESYGSVPPSRIVRDARHVYLCDEGVTARDRSDGRLGWLFGDRRDVGDSAGETRLYGAPALRDGVLYCTEGDRGVVAVDALTGSLNWLEKGLQGRRLHRDVPPVVGERYLYSLDDRGLRAVDLRTRRAVWTYETDATVLTPDHARQRLYVREQRETFALPLA
ncbi:protein kinase [Streptomyces sp. NPDC057702]|uniref:protein kinase domain-containing protein n=1 Tax=unclassified Streptomyces TaxID=2593676 RepID=UPI00368736AB